MRAIVLIPLIPLLCWQGIAAEASIADDKIEKGQQAIYRLEFDLAEEIFKNVIAEAPQSPRGYGLMAVLRWNQLLQAAGNLVLEDYATPTPFEKGRTYKPIETETKNFKEANERLISVCDKLLAKDSRDVEALYFKGVAYENFAAEELAVKKSQTGAIPFGKRAKSLHEQVLNLEPDFIDAFLSIATEEFARATLPWGIKWFVFLLGMGGNKERALDRLEKVAEGGEFRKLDAQVVLALLNAWKGDPRKAVEILSSLARIFPSNYMFDLQIAAIYELKLKDLRSALGVYENLAASLDSKAPGLGAGEVYFRIGKTRYKLREYSVAIDALQKALELPFVEKETRPLSSYYLARIHEEQGEMSLARSYYQRVLEYSGPANVLEDEIKRARKILKD